MKAITNFANLTQLSFFMQSFLHSEGARLLAAYQNNKEKWKDKRKEGNSAALVEKRERQKSWESKFLESARICSRPNSECTPCCQKNAFLFLCLFYYVLSVSFSVSVSVLFSVSFSNNLCIRVFLCVASFSFLCLIYTPWVFQSSRLFPK